MPDIQVTNKWRREYLGERKERGGGRGEWGGSQWVYHKKLNIFLEYYTPHMSMVVQFINSVAPYGDLTLPTY